MSTQFAMTYHVNIKSDDCDTQWVTVTWSPGVKPNFKFEGFDGDWDDRDFERFDHLRAEAVKTIKFLQVALGEIG